MISVLAGIFALGSALAHPAAPPGPGLYAAPPLVLARHHHHRHRHWGRYSRRYYAVPEPPSQADSAAPPATSYAMPETGSTLPAPAAPVRNPRADRTNRTAQQAAPSTVGPTIQWVDPAPTR